MRLPMQKAKKLKGNPDYRLDPQSHRYKKIDFIKNELKESFKDIVKNIYNEKDNYTINMKNGDMIIVKDLKKDDAKAIFVKNGIYKEKLVSELEINDLRNESFSEILRIEYNK